MFTSGLKFIFLLGYQPTLCSKHSHLTKYEPHNLRAVDRTSGIL